jgi:hypothetical protein
VSERLKRMALDDEGEFMTVENHPVISSANVVLVLQSASGALQLQGFSAEKGDSGLEERYARFLAGREFPGLSSSFEAAGGMKWKLIVTDRQ